MKHCTKCDKIILEDDEDTKWAMIITKRGKKIIEFECFHLECWRGCFEGGVEMAGDKKLFC